MGAESPRHYLQRLAYSELQLTRPVDFQMGVLAAHLRGFCLACTWFARAIFKSCTPGFLFLTCLNSPLLHVQLQRCLHFSEGTLQLAVPLLAVKLCL